MKNIYEILKSIGIEVPEEKKETFDKEVTSNYKTIKEVSKIQDKLDSANKSKEELENKIESREKDFDDLKKQLEESGNDKQKLEEALNQIDKLQNDYNEQKTEYSKKLNNQKYEFAIKEKSNNLKFSSNSAKKSFIRDLMDNRLTMKDGEILGFDDFVKNYKEQDEGAFIEESSTGEQKKPSFSSKTHKIDTKKEEPSDDEPKSRPLVW